MSQQPSLARQNTVALALAFVVMELLVMAVFVGWVLLPLGRRSADDLAGLMVLSAQTWAELPPQTRAAFEVELFDKHALALRSDPPGPARDEWHPPYFYLLEEALAQRLQRAQHLSREATDTGTWYWAQVPVGRGYLSVGLADDRVDSQPITAFVVALVAGLALAKFIASAGTDVAALAGSSAAFAQVGASYAAAGAIRAIPMAEGGSGTVTKPTLFLAGEAGTESFAFGGANNKLMGGGGGRSYSTTTVNNTVIQNIGGSVIAERQVKSLAMSGLAQASRGY